MDQLEKLTTKKEVANILKDKELNELKDQVDELMKQVADEHGLDIAKQMDAAGMATSNPAGKVGDWDKLRLRVKGDIVRVWVNGVKVAEADLSKWTTAQKNPDGSKNKFKTALNDLPKIGHIGFQDRGHNVSCRNVFLKEL